MTDKLTIKSQQALQRAQSMAQVSDHQSIETAHIARAILQEDDSVSPFLLKKLSINQNILEQILDKSIEGFPKVKGGNVYLSQNGNKVIALAEKELKSFQDEYISIEHLWLGLLEVNDTTSNILKDAGMKKSELLEAIKELRKGKKSTSADSESTYNALEKYAINLNEQVKSGKLDPIIGRDEEIRRVIQILSRRTKNNPILIGEPGVGKTAIAEGIAHRIVDEDVPENLKSKTVFSLDMGALVAGAKYKGEFEERLKAVVQEVIGSDGEIVLFIDEIHTLVGAGKSDGAMDAANILKPALARGELRAVGATTLDEYQKYFEKDKALVRRFQTVTVDEPSTEDAISILRGIKEKYENHHKVMIKDEAIISAVNLSQRYISDRQLPDKAIDLIDEAASKLRMEMNSKPQELDEIERKIMQLEVEREAIKREKDKAKLDSIAKDLADLSEKKNSFLAKWKTEKNALDGIQAVKEDIEQYKLEAEQAERNGDYGLVAEIRYGKIKEAEEELERLKKQLSELSESQRVVKEEVDSEEIAGVVSSWTGIPLSKMLQTEKEKLLHLEDVLKKRVVGQDEAVELVADAVRRSRSGLQDQNKPIGSFIFLGTTGVGKTELAKALSEYLFNDENAMVRIDMSEYQERHAVSRLVGAPPGYVGYDEGGQLTEAVRRKPYSVILLDEIEKAHPDVFNTLLQVLDDGRLTDNKGRVVNFKNTIIIMTSNMGAELIESTFANGDGQDKDSLNAKAKMQVFELLKANLRPEFLNRIDETVMFNPLGREEIHQIVKIQLANLNKRLAQNEIQLHASDEALEWLAELGYDPQFGARPVKRVIQKRVLNALSKQLLSGKVESNSNLILDVFGDEMVFRKPINQEEEEAFELA